MSYEYYFTKDLASQLNAKFYEGLESIKDKFDLSSFIDSIEDDKIKSIVGTIEGKEYCFLEYLNIENKALARKFRLIFKLNEIPDFELMTKNQAIKNGLVSIVTGIVALFSSIMVYYYTETSIFAFLNYFLLFFMVLIGLLGLSYGISYFTKINDCKKYGICNKNFENKYAIISSDDPNIIKEIFNDEVCKKIVELPYDMVLTTKRNIIEEGSNYKIRDNFIIEDLFIMDKSQLYLSQFCNLHLKNLNTLIKLFNKEKDSSN